MVQNDADVIKLAIALKFLFLLLLWHQESPFAELLSASRSGRSPIGRLVE